MSILPSENKKQWRKDAKAFGCAFWNYWQWWISTISGSAVLVILRWSGKMTTFPSWAIWLIGVFGIVVASFLAWRDQWRTADAREIEIAQLKRQQIEQNQALQAQIDDSAKRKSINAKLGEFHQQLQNRVDAIKGLKPIDYYRQYQSDYDKSILDHDSQLLIDKIAAFVQEHFGWSAGHDLQQIVTMKLISGETEGHYHFKSIRCLQEAMKILKELSKKVHRNET